MWSIRGRTTRGIWMRCAREGEARGGIEGVVLTHSHADHSAGVRALGAPLLWGEVSEGDETAALAGAVPARTDADRAHPSVAGCSSSRVGPLEVVPTPGHARDHVVFVWGDVCFCGDLILGEGSSDRAAWSLRRLARGLHGVAAAGS